MTPLHMYLVPLNQKIYLPSEIAYFSYLILRKVKILIISYAKQLPYLRLRKKNFNLFLRKYSETCSNVNSNHNLTEPSSRSFC